MFRPTLGHHQVVLSSLKTVHEVEGVYSDDEISFILHIYCYLLGLKVVGLVVLDFGCGVVERIGRCCILLWVLSFSCSVSPVLCFPIGSCYKAGVWVNLTVCLLRSVRVKKNGTKCGVV